jgi:hypothetical protein
MAVPDRSIDSPVEIAKAKRHSMATALTMGGAKFVAR